MPAQDKLITKTHLIETVTPIHYSEQNVTTVEDHIIEIVEQELFIEQIPSTHVVNKTIVTHSEYSLTKPTLVTETEIIGYKETHKHDEVVEIHNASDITYINEIITVETHTQKSD